MSITQKNPTTFSYADLSDAQTQTYKGKADITLSNYDSDSEPVVKVGSAFENNGSLFIVDTSDITPTGYSGISVSTTFYLYYDESGGAFIYSSTAPTWSDALQGWYNGNDRAFFSIYKDSTGALYEKKQQLGKQKIPGDTIEKLTVNQNLDVSGNITYDSKQITSANYFHTSTNQDVFFGKLSPFIPNVGDNMMMSGGIRHSTGSNYIVSRAKKNTATTIILYCSDAATGAATAITVTDGATGVSIGGSLSW